MTPLALQFTHLKLLHSHWRLDGPYMLPQVLVELRDVDIGPNFAIFTSDFLVAGLAHRRMRNSCDGGKTRAS